VSDPAVVPWTGQAPSLGDVKAALDGWFDPRWAESWDAVGLVCGDPGEPVRRIVLAVDAVPATVAEAVDVGAQLLITHHPLLLSGVHGVPADDPKGALVHRMIRAGVAHLVAHTNADVADPGVSDALAARLGLTDVRPLSAQDGAALDKLVVFVPHADVRAVVDALARAGAGRLGDYDHCSWTTQGEGTFRPLDGAHPALGSIGELARVPETRIEMVVPRAVRADVVAALRAAHPYEEPAFDLLAQAPLPSRRGTGRLGELPATTTLAAFTAQVAAVLPATVWGVRAAGDPDRPVRTVAVCGGSGGSLADEARRVGADAYVTADLRHHPAVEGVTELGPDAMALVDAAHWATEAPWLDVLALALRERFGTTVDVRVSTLVTDPWTVHAPSDPPIRPNVPRSPNRT
jgi:dinuclear metal center YbgI/SA1388 family protein